MRDVQDKIQKALDQAPVDLLLRDASVINVVSGEIYRASVAVVDGRIVGFGEYQAREVIELDGAYLAPSFIDGHIHLESSLLTVGEFARAIVPHGTGAVVIDPHELANVLGLEGIRYVLEERPGLPLDLFIMLPSCVPATPLESSGARLTAWDLHLLIEEPRVVGIGEMMNYPGVLAGDGEVLAKLLVGHRKRIDGHAPRLSGKQLNAYALAGARSDHESITVEEAREKLRLGMHVHLREGSAEKNLLDLLPLVSPANSRNFSFVTDDRHPASLISEGHIDNNVRLAIAAGLDPVTAIQMATINTAEFYRLKNIGAILPRYWADLVVFDDLRAPNPRLVFKKGELVARDGKPLFKPCDVEHAQIRGTMNVAWLNDGDFRINLPSIAEPPKEASRANCPAATATGPSARRRVRVIEAIPGQIVTRLVEEDATVRGDEAVADPERDLLKLAVIERHRATGRIGLGFAKGFGLKRGALASSVGHDSHNLCVLGTNDADMLRAAIELIDLKGGMVVVVDGEVKAALALPIAGLMSEQPLEQVAAAVHELNAAAHEAGCTLPDAFAAMSFLSLVPIPELRLTDQGLVDARKFERVSLFV